MKSIVESMKHRLGCVYKGMGVSLTAGEQRRGQLDEPVGTRPGQLHPPTTLINFEPTLLTSLWTGVESHDSWWSNFATKSSRSSDGWRVTQQHMHMHPSSYTNPSAQLLSFSSYSNPGGCHRCRKLRSRAFQSRSR